MGASNDLGYAMRRRKGAPSNYFEAAGPTNGRSYMTSEEHYEMAKQANSPRIAVGKEEQEEGHDVISDKQDADDYTAKAAQPERGQMTASGNSKSVDPAAQPMGYRQNVMYNERLGASYTVSVPFTPTVDPTVGPTMANARTVPSVQGRQNPNFQASISDQY